MGLTLITAATSDPVTWPDVAGDILDYQDNGANNARLESVIAAATQYVQLMTAKQLIQATWLQTCDCWPDYEFTLDMKPLISVSSIKYYDANGTQQTVSASNYFADIYAYRPRIRLRQATFTWPDLQEDRPSPIEVRFVAGHANAAAVPSDLKLAISMLAMYWYEQRQAVGVKQSAEPAATVPVYADIPYGVAIILAQHNASGYS